MRRRFAATTMMLAWDVMVTAADNQPPVANVQADPTAPAWGEEVCFYGGGS